MRLNLHPQENVLNLIKHTKSLLLMSLKGAGSSAGSAGSSADPIICRILLMDKRGRYWAPAMAELVWEAVDHVGS